MRNLYRAITARDRPYTHARICYIAVADSACDWAVTAPRAARHACTSRCCRRSFKRFNLLMEERGDRATLLSFSLLSLALRSAPGRTEPEIIISRNCAAAAAGRAASAIYRTPSRSRRKCRVYVCIYIHVYVCVCVCDEKRQRREREE